jgi:hypothetical protein
VLYCAGFWEQTQKRGWDFAAKTSLLKDLRIVAPDVLGRINRLRNTVEHEYSAPRNVDQLNDFIDVVDLFVAHAEPFAHRRYESSEYFTTVPKHTTVR